nr:GMC family oxidoreductase [Streptomyces sp. SID2888]
MAVARTPEGVRRFGPDVVLGDLLTSRLGGFELRPDTLCEGVVMADGRAVGVRLRDRTTGAVTAVRAAHVVVAGDPLRTPQLLFASGVRPSALGRHLNEHSQVSLLAEVDGLPPEHEAADVGGSGVTWIPYEGEAYPFHGMLVQIDPDTLPHLAGHRRERRPLISVHFFTAQEPRPDNRLVFSETEQDWLGMPAMTIRHRLGERDREVLAYAETEVFRLAKILGRPAEGEIPRVLPSGSSLHYQGTVRTGPADDGTSVCDPTCRVWGTDNLYVAGNGVIPTQTACNPTLTAVALAVLGARALVRRW